MTIAVQPTCANYVFFPVSKVLSGVGQWSILGVIMLLMFFNDSDVIMTGIYCLNFADDKKIASIIKSEEDAMNLQIAINAFFKWCGDNGLEINRTKYKIITYTLKTRPIMFDYTLDDETIQRTDSIFDLGILMNAKMNVNSHYEYVSNKSKSVLNFVKRQRQFLDDDATKIVYKALVRSNLEFAACIWSPYFVTHQNTIESTQKQFVMFMNRDYLNRSENNYVLSPYVERCGKHKLQTLIRRRANACILFIHSVLTGRISSPALRSRITFNARPTRHNGMIFIRSYRTGRSTYSPFNIACRMFDAVSSIIDPTLPHMQFRNALQRVPDSDLRLFLTLWYDHHWDCDVLLYLFVLFNLIASSADCVLLYFISLTDGLCVYFYFYVLFFWRPDVWYFCFCSCFYFFLYLLYELCTCLILIVRLY